jgi:hypothetical protein
LSAAMVALSTVLAAAMSVVARAVAGCAGGPIAMLVAASRHHVPRVPWSLAAVSMVTRSPWASVRGPGTAWTACSLTLTQAMAGKGGERPCV